MISWISIGVAVLALAVGAVAILMARRQAKAGRTLETNYRTIFITGLVMLALGVIMAVVYYVLQIPFYFGLTLFVLGVVYTAVGAANRSRWPARS